MPYLLWILMIFIGLICPKNKFITIIQIIYIWIVIGFNTASPDFLNNRFMYDNIDSGLYGLYEPLHILLIKLCRSFGMDFTGFRCVVAAIMLFIIYIALRKRVIQKNVVLSTFIVYPILGFSSGLRSAIPFGITIYAVLKFVMEDKNNSLKASLKYAILIMLATLFHYSFIIYFVLLFIKRKFDSKRIFEMLMVEVIVLLALRWGFLYSLAGRFIHSQKVLSWLNINSYNHPSLIVDAIILLVVLGTTYYFARGIRHRYNDKKSMNLIIKNCCWIMIMLVPTLFLNVTFERFELVFLSIIIVLIVDKFSINSIRKFSYPIIGLVYNIAFSFVIHGNIFFPMLKNNFIIK